MQWRKTTYVDSISTSIPQPHHNDAITMARWCSNDKRLKLDDRTLDVTHCERGICWLEWQQQGMAVGAGLRRCFGEWNVASFIDMQPILTTLIRDLPSPPFFHRPTSWSLTSPITQSHPWWVSPLQETSMYSETTAPPPTCTTCHLEWPGRYRLQGRRKLQWVENYYDCKQVLTNTKAPCFPPVVYIISYLASSWRSNWACCNTGTWAASTSATGPHWLRPVCKHNGGFHVYNVQRRKRGRRGYE